MDQIKIGKFIAEMRKEQNMTQKQLAETLNISDKTISKWECGKGMPDNSILLELCEALHINVNELLSGEKVSSDNYHRKAEENMLQLIDKSKKEQNNHKWNILGVLLELFIVFLLVFVSSGGLRIRADIFLSDCHDIYNSHNTYLDQRLFRAKVLPCLNYHLKRHSQVQAYSIHKQYHWG